MQPEATQPAIAADDVGIRFLRSGRDDIIVDWGEIESVDVARYDSTDDSSFFEVYINHVSGVDFRFKDVDVGYEQVMESMEQYLIGFSRDKAEVAGAREQALNTIPVWKRDEGIQPFELRLPKINTREPTAQELMQMQLAHRASVASCEKILGRTLTPDEMVCVETSFENGSVKGNIAPPLSRLLIERQTHM
ncbi:MAG TPA: hypothetical protein VFE58_19765 [Tepidisphaeraceae bacterium]|jgi:hypothetical protein|nr:hypothetical protein [Tepidisphaeraceae bacterium]